MSPAFSVFVLMSNYFHDVATAMLVACSVTMWTLLKAMGTATEGLDLLMKLHRVLAAVVWFSWFWILSAGALRLLTFGSFEWVNAVDKQMTAGLTVKYVIAMAMIICGGYFWAAVSRKVKRP